jgi:hypothetical protein
LTKLAIKILIFQFNLKYIIYKLINLQTYFYLYLTRIWILVILILGLRHYTSILGLRHYTSILGLKRILFPLGIKLTNPVFPEYALGRSSFPLEPKQLGFTTLVFFFFYCFRTGFWPTKSGRLIGSCVEVYAPAKHCSLWESNAILSKYFPGKSSLPVKPKQLASLH